MFCFRSSILFLLLVTGCGKVGAPRPPIIRIPQNTSDLSARQDANNIVLMWTNPAIYTDANPVESLTAYIVHNGKDVAMVPVIGGGKPQTHSIDVSDAIGMEQTFTVRFEAERGRAPGVSNTVTIQPVAVPGPVAGLSGLADQYRIRVSWQRPESNGTLAESYIVQRSDGPAPQIVNETFYDDREIEPGATYIYTVRAARGADATIAGPPAPPATVVASDKTGPAAPVGVMVEPDPVVAGRVFVTWDDNTEADLAGYQVYRSERQDGPWILRTPMLVQKGFFDTDYVAGMYYSIFAVDFFGNESPRSSPQQGL